ncbi:MAG: glycoside hydrolase family 3 N-terminal domain-containing protein [Bacteroidales bacterium]
MTRTVVAFSWALLFTACSMQLIGQTTNAYLRADSLLKLMTLKEKVGQLNQYNDDWDATGPVTVDTNKAEQVKNGEVGSLLNCVTVQRTRKWQLIAMQSRLKIPLLFGQDIIHGYKTTFPIPLGESCSWDLDAIGRSERVAATEASSAGIHWTFAPMVDIARDPRWGRVMEGSGEDPYLGSLIAAARDRGFQGENLGATNALMACAKHFAAYGAAIGGRDYNSVDMSVRLLREVYLPPFKAAVDAGVATVMTSFNDINGVPSTGNNELLTQILRKEWGFTGFVVSDWGSVGEMVSHGNVAGDYEAALSAINAGCDMDMESRCYRNHLEKLVREGLVSSAALDDAVRRILVKKFELGLFEDPYRFCSEERERKALNNPEHTAMAREMARKSIVLLKNENHLLPLSPTLKSIAVIGPMVKAVNQNKGSWDVNVPGVDSNLIVTWWEGISARVSRETRLHYALGCDFDGESRKGFDEAIAVAKQADVVLFTMGERRDMSGEAKSRSNIGIPGVQEELLELLLKTGKPVVVLISAGRPLVFNYTADHAQAILYTWWLGSEAGNAVADVLFGDYNPSAKLTMTFPRSVGQIPMYYSHFNTGRPAQNNSDRFYGSAYTDLSSHPKYEFGYGLSYTTFRYGNLEINRKQFGKDDVVIVRVTVSNTGPYDGEEIVQLYIRDLVGSICRPVSELKDFVKVSLKKGESKTITFNLDAAKLSFFDQNAKPVLEPGHFAVMIGASSGDIRLKDQIELMK